MMSGITNGANKSALPFVRLARQLLILVLLGFAAFLFGGLAFTEMGSQFIQQLPTLGMIIVLADLYAGSFVIMLWAFYREKHPWVAVIWSVSFILLGNLATLAYVLCALRTVRSNHDLHRFFHGHRAPSLLAAGSS